MIGWTGVILAAVIGLAAGLLIGWWGGRNDGLRLARVEQERMTRLAPPNRTPGLPTNTTGPPSEVRNTRWRNGQFYTPDSKEW